MCFRCHALIESQFYSSNDNLFVVMKHKSKDIGHLAITTKAAEHLVLKLPKG